MNSLNKERNYMKSESFVGADSHWQQGTYSNKEELPLRVLPYAVCVSLNKSVKPPPDPAGLLRECFPKRTLTD